MKQSLTNFIDSEYKFTFNIEMTIVMYTIYNQLNTRDISMADPAI